ncbi:putative ATP-dependent RNA helicase TDRD12 [Anthonomus grandis grandis]|uniref:putative ATP-dependent RNA helicase TDRD12 n=1 Tax=Anthonomus grandis grandis TaxID=2921223 RepID=UPI0021656D54|nr:putative ATP-dependent RNA helicase TDRD12 [Anthonomus grandis grandis]
MNSSEILDIQILKFVNPHIFFVTTDLDKQHRASQLKHISDRIKSSNLVPNADASTLPADQIIAVQHEGKFLRATVLEKINLNDSGGKLFNCWLVDKALTIKTDQIFEISKELQNIAPGCKQASLNNICYLHEKLELGVMGTKKLIPSILPSAGTIQCALDLLSNSEKMQIKVAEKFGNTLIGELIIYKEGKTLFLTQELLKRELIAINEVMFTGLKCSTREFLMSHIGSIYRNVETSSVSNKNSKNNDSLSKVIYSIQDDIEEIDVLTTPPLENGRRRKNKLVTPKPESDKENGIFPPDTKMKPTPQRHAKLRMLLKKRQQEIESNKEKYEPKDSVECQKTSMRMSESSEGDLVISGSSSSLLENVSNDDSIIEIQGNKFNKSKEQSSESDVSFQSMICQRKSLLKGKFFPAGMERNFCHAKSSISTSGSSQKSQRKKIAALHNKNPEVQKSEAEEDSPAIIQDPNVPDTDQESNQEVKSDVIPEESSESETVPKKVFTKQDFCQLVQGCTCVTCRITLEDDDWDSPIQFESEKKDDNAKVPGIIIKAPRLLKVNSEKKPSKQSEILSVNYGEMSSMDKNLTSKVLVHGESIPTAIKRVAQVMLHKNIHANLSRMNYIESKRIQYYAFPAITRNQNVFMVNEKNSGKTMAYLPIVLSFILEKEERYNQLFKMGGGPIVVVLCSNSNKCEEVYDLANMVLSRQNKKCHLVTYPRYGNISNVDILITMPTVLQTLISSRATNFKRLCHLVLEDADVLLKQNNELILKFLNYADSVLGNRNCPKAVQLIACAQHWTPQLENLLTILDKIPTVCIGNHLESALYGKMKFSLKFLNSRCKEEYLLGILQDKFKFMKSIVICNENEIEGVQNGLMLNGIDYVSFLNVTQQEDIYYNEQVWNNAHPGKYSVLICTDEIYNTMSLTSAHLLVHFSLPYSWAQFIRRFSCFLENIHSPLTDSAQKKIQISSHVLIDEKCEERMSRFSNFIKIAGLEKDVPDNVKTFFKQIKIRDEKTRIMKKTDLCHTLRVFGQCAELNCKKRHFADKTLDQSDLVPKNGSIHFKILKMLDSGSCSVKILEAFDLNGNSVQKYHDRNSEIAAILSKKCNYRSVSKPTVTHQYLIKHNGEFYRSKLVENDGFPLLFCIDKGIYLKGSLDSLFKMPEELKKIPPQCFEIHFANLIPPFEDATFSRLAGIKAQFLKDSNCPDSVMIGTIVLQLGNVLWLDDVYEIREMHDKTFPTMGFQLSRELVKEGLAVKSPKPLKNLYKLCKECGIDLPEYKVSKRVVRNVMEEKQAIPNWAFLNIEELHEVTFTFAESPENFYVRQNKFTRQLEDLEHLIQQEIRKPFYPTLKEVKVGQCCLYQDEVSKEYGRGLVLEIENNEAKIMSVDYGDICWDQTANLKHISNEVILKLPFQAVRCSLIGVKSIDEEWSFEAVDLLYKMAYEDDLCTKLRLLYVKVNSKQDNPQVRGQFCYSVTVKEGLNRRVLINKLLLDCGFAMRTDEEIMDFDLPEVQEEVDDDIIEEDQPEFMEEVEQVDEEFPSAPNPDILQFDIDGFDCVIFDPSQFLIDTKAAKSTKDNRTETEAPRDLPAIKAAPEVNYLTPAVVWSQTGEYLKLNIQVSEVNHPEMTVKKSRLFCFSASKGEKEYALKLLLYSSVESTCQHTILGSQIRVTLKKRTEGEWPRLLRTSEKMRKITYDTGAIKVDEGKPRKFLDLGLSDSSSAGDDEYYYDVSELDSEYDFDIPNDEEY